MIRIVFPAEFEENVAFAACPSLEAVLSLHVLQDPGHHALQHPWVRRARTLPAALRREIEALGWVYRHQIPDAFLPPGREAPRSFEAELERVRRLPAEQLLGAFGRPLYDHGGDGTQLGRKRVQEAMLARPELTERERDAVRLLLADPSAFADRLCGLLERYWRAGFGAEWDRVEPLLAAAIVEAGEALVSGDVGLLLGRLPHRCSYDARHRELRVRSPHEHRVEISPARPLVLLPSAYVWPHVRVNCDEPWPLALSYTAPAVRRETEPRLPPSELLRVLRAVGDDTRLRLLRLVAEQPRTTQELEPIVGLSRAGLSKGLRRLAEAGLIEPHREGYYVVYRLVPERLDAIAPALAAFLSPGAAASRSPAGGRAAPRG